MANKGHEALERVEDLTKEFRSAAREIVRSTDYLLTNYKQLSATMFKFEGKVG